MKILVTGGCGFVGSILVSKLLKEKHHVTVVDTQWFGNFLTKHKNLLIKKKEASLKVHKNVNIKVVKIKPISPFKGVTSADCASPSDGRQDAAKAPAIKLVLFVNIVQGFLC